MKNKRITSAIAALALVIVGSFAVPAMATDEDTGGQCVPSDARTETRTVIDQPASDQIVVDVAEHWQRYSWTGGPHTSDDAPAFPSSDWQPNVQGDPHNIGVVGAYYRSNGNSGNGDWFYLEWIEAVTRTVEHPAITHEETIAHPAIVCPSAEVVVEEDVIVPEVVVEEDVIVPEVVVVVAPAAVVVAPAAVVVAPAAVVVAPAAVVVAPAAVVVAPAAVVVAPAAVVVAPAAVVVAPAAVAIAADPRFAG